MSRLIRSNNERTNDFIPSPRCPLIVATEKRTEMTSTTTSSEPIEFDFSQLDESLLSEEQKQNFIDYVSEIQRQKRTIEDELNQLKLSSGTARREVLLEIIIFFAATFCL